MIKFLISIVIFFIPTAFITGGLYFNYGCNKNIKNSCNRYMFLDDVICTEYVIKYDYLIKQYYSRLNYVSNDGECNMKSEFSYNLTYIQILSDNFIGTKLKDVYKIKNHGRCKTNYDELYYNWKVGSILLILASTTFVWYSRNFNREFDTLESLENMVIEIPDEAKIPIAIILSTNIQEYSNLPVAENSV